MRLLFLLFVVAAVLLLAWYFVLGPVVARRRAARAPWVVRFHTQGDEQRQVLLVRGEGAYREHEVFGTVPSRNSDPFDAEYEELKVAAESEARERNRMLKAERRL